MFLKVKLLVISVLMVFLSLYFSDTYKYCFNSATNFFFGHEARHKPLFTKEELKKYNGVDTPELYLAILGNVYNVTKGESSYGPGQTYHIFIGQDASRSFVTGKFGKEDVSDKVSDFNSKDLRSLNHWVKFYKKEYPMVGKLIGSYYDENGAITAYGKLVKKLIKKAEKEDENEQLEKIKFPPCNIEWEAESGTRVWCTKLSGGIQRDWIGVPRQLYETGSEGYRCACIGDENINLATIKEYEGCEPNSSSCFVMIH